MDKPRKCPRCKGKGKLLPLGKPSPLPAWANGTTNVVIDLWRK